MNTTRTGRLSAAAARKPWLTLSLWLVAIIGMAGAATTLQLVDDEGGSTFESAEAYELWEQHNADYTEPTETIVVSSQSLTIGDPAFTSHVDALITAAQGVDGVASVQAPDAQTGTVSADGDTALITVILAQTDDDALLEVAAELKASMDKAAQPEIRAGLVGNYSGTNVFDKLAEDTLLKGELIGIGVALIILAIVFGAVVAATTPIMIAITSIITATGLAALISNVMDLHTFTLNMVTMMGLALGIDYALVAVQRFREELANGRSVPDAVAVTGSTANRAILISGTTVVVSLLGMLLIPSTIMRSLGLGAILVAITSVAAALTLLPALLKVLGTRINGGRLRRTRTAQGGGVWAKIARGAVARPVASALMAIAVLIALAVPALSLRQGFSGVESLPADNDLRVSVERIADEFGYGSNTTYVALTGEAMDGADALAAQIEADPAFADVEIQRADGATFVTARDVFEASEVEATEAIDRVRNEHIPATVGDAGQALVGGESADSVDFSGLMNDWFPWVVTGVLLVSFLILMVVFRSLAVPAMTLFVNALSVAAAYGVLVGTFQFGWGDSLGFTQVDTIAPWLPLFLFAVLFGLSMDYHVFLLSRVKEAHAQHGDPREAIITGVRTTGALITGAALIMVAVFGGFASGDISELSQMGLGLAAAIILDATLVRVVLVPALLTLLGERAWTVPSWLEWLPRGGVEGQVDPAPRVTAPTTAPEFREDAYILAGARNLDK
jgi:RND superfamily putative drug exporter